MDFFEAQDRAKKNTGKLLLLYLIAVIGIVSSVFLSLAVLFSYLGSGSVSEWLQQYELLVLVTIITLIVIIIGTVFRVVQLRKGGSVVAEMLGGRKVDSSTTDSGEQRYLNIVEEMAIASGLPVPDIYILDQEESINAFAAGFGTNDAAVGVTRGAIDQLNRDELQGVIAHEFSHIFNGDMRLNIRLIGILNGILLIHLMGLMIVRSIFYTGGTRTRKSSSDKGGGNITFAIIMFGFALIVIGYIGMIFARMIQSAISRQREYLADAAAVQYTRNPDGLAGALNKIKNKKNGSEINDGHSMEMSHLFFANSFNSFFGRILSTHPPIDQRIKAISPSFERVSSAQKKRNQKFQKSHVSGKSGSPDQSPITSSHAAITPEVLIAAIGTIDANQIEQSRQILENIPAKLKKASHEPFSAEALIYALVLKTYGKQSAGNSDILSEASNELLKLIDELITELNKCERLWYLPLAEISIPSLKKMSLEQYETFKSDLNDIIAEDKNQNLFSFALKKTVLHHLDLNFAISKNPAIRHHHFKSLENELAVLLSAVSYASGNDSEMAWEKGYKSIQSYVSSGFKLLPANQCRTDHVDSALDEFSASANPVKKYLIHSLISAIMADDSINIDEMELIRAISETIDCPIPFGLLMKHIDKSD